MIDAGSVGGMVGRRSVAVRRVASVLLAVGLSVVGDLVATARIFFDPIPSYYTASFSSCHTESFLAKHKKDCFMCDSWIGRAEWPNVSYIYR